MLLRDKYREINYSVLVLHMYIYIYIYRAQIFDIFIIFFYNFLLYRRNNFIELKLISFTDCLIFLVEGIFTKLNKLSLFSSFFYALMSSFTHSLSQRSVSPEINPYSYLLLKVCR